MSTQTMGFHLDGTICRVGCSFCYLGARTASTDRALEPELLADIVGALPAREIAVAVSEPARRWRSGLSALAEAAARKGVHLTITTTPDVVADDPWVLDGASRVSFSLDPEKVRPEKSGADAAMALRPRRPGGIDFVTLDRALAECARRERLEVVALVSLVTPDLASTLADGLLGDLLAWPGIDAVALNGLKPPPPWCDRAFWLRFATRIRPLLEKHLHRRLHLDCYVGARILGLGGCPAKPDVSPGREFRACVYQSAPDFVFADAAELARRTAGYTPPAVCPFPIP